MADSHTDVVHTDVEERESDIGDEHSIKAAETDSLQDVTVRHTATEYTAA